MKKAIFVMIFLILVSFCFVGCGTKVNNGANDKLKIISTIFPYYDFTKEICSDNVDLTLLLPPGSESHSYEPSAKDIIAIENCDLFIYTGGESDAWVDDLISSLDIKINTLKAIDFIEPIKEDGEDVYDEHIWTSPKNAVLITKAITEKVSELDSKNGSIYLENSNNYIAKLEVLDKDFTDFFKTVSNKTLVFGDRFPFRYFADVYGLKYYAAFPGCSNETEPSASIMATLINAIKSDNIKTVFYIEFSNHRIADSIAETTNINTAMLHSCHNVSQKEMEDGATYLTLMRQNLDTLKEALK